MQQIKGTKLKRPWEIAMYRAGQWHYNQSRSLLWQLYDPAHLHVIEVIPRKKHMMHTSSKKGPTQRMSFAFLGHVAQK